MKGKRWLVLPVSLAVVLLASSIGGTAASFVDQESSSSNTFEAWTSVLWQQTTQADFEAGVQNNTDTSSNPGDVKLRIRGGWYDASWSYRVPITINNPGASLADYQIKIDVIYDADMQPDFDDVRFTQDDGTTELSYWRESYAESSSATFWVKVSTIPTGNSMIYMYYGNPAVASASSGDNTFIFYDSFEVDLTKWAEINSGAGSATRVTNPPAAHGNYSVKIEDTSIMDGYGIKAKFASQSICVIEFYIRLAQTDMRSVIKIKDSTGANGPTLRFNKDSTIEYKVAGTWTDIDTLTYSADTWYEFKLTEIDSVDDTYDIYLDGQLELNDAGFDVAITDIRRVRFRGTASGTPAFYIDLFRVRKYASAEPTTSVGSEEGMYISMGTIASQVLDTGVTGASWDALFWDETLPSNTDITFEVRASDTLFAKNDASPSWTPVGGTSPVTSGLPSGRYMQWRATLTTPDTSRTPTLHEVRVYY